MTLCSAWTFVVLSSLLTQVIHFLCNLALFVYETIMLAEHKWLSDTSITTTGSKKDNDSCIDAALHNGSAKAPLLFPLLVRKTFKRTRSSHDVAQHISYTFKHIYSSIMAFRWFYLAGSTWVPFDDQANAVVEGLWRANSHGNVYHAGTVAYVNAVNLYMIQGNVRRTIYRTGA